jgi:two-component system, OmpR family, sensor histidine kinase MprB
VIGRIGRMPFRRRLVLATAVAVAVAVALASLATYLLVRSQLRGQVDQELERFAGGVFVVRTGAPGDTKAVRQGRTPAPGPRDRIAKAFSVALPRDPLGANQGYAQFVTARGRVIAPPVPRARLPVDARTIGVARGDHGPFFSEADVNGVHARIYTRQAGPGRAVQTARSLESVDESLRQLAIVLGLVSLGGIGLAAGLAVLVGRAATRPVKRLTEAAEHVASTRDLSRRIALGGDDEIGRLATSFNTMLEALERSVGAQRQLVADASHELRTPLTSLRTNIEVLEGNGLGPQERRRLLADVVAQLEELGELVGDLVDLARGEEQPVRSEHVRLDELLAEAVERARRHAPGQRFAVTSEPCLVLGSPQRLERGIANLLDNASKWNPPDRPIEVTLRGGELRVRDHGPGFAAADLEHVFDRFYRSPSARGMRGSGLGLAIVRQVAESHGGSVEAANAEGGGALLRLVLATS